MFYWALGEIKTPPVALYVAFGESKFEDTIFSFTLMPLRELFFSYMTYSTASNEDLKA